jgi:hypothetical protein
MREIFHFMYVTDTINPVREIWGKLSTCADTNFYDKFSMPLAAPNIFVKDLRFLQRWLWRVLSPGIQRRVVRSQPMFRRNISPPSSGSNKPRNIPAWKQVESWLPLWRWRRYIPPKCRLTFNGTTWYYIPEESTLYLFVRTGKIK